MLVFSLRPAHEEPQPVADDPSAEGRFVDAVDLVDVIGFAVRSASSSIQSSFVSVSRNEPENSLPPDLVIVRDHAAGEAAVLGGDAAGEERRLLDRVLDEERPAAGRAGSR